MTKTATATILVVEDEPPLQNAISTSLTKIGYAVVTARSADEAVEALKSHPIALIWLDHYLLGEKDGLSLVSQLRKKAAWQDLPIFVITNTASEDKINNYADLGVKHYYIKSDHRLESIINDIRATLAESEATK